MLVGAGVMTILLSSEICWRYYKANKRELDPELDNLTNPQVGSGHTSWGHSLAGRCHYYCQEVKHWIDPRIMPYGWGTFDTGRVEELGCGDTRDVSCIILPILSVDRDTPDTRPHADS